MSSITDLYKQFFTSTWKVTQYSPEKAGHAAASFWWLCIGAGVEFEIDDFGSLASWCAEDRWRPLFHCPGEHHYAEAVHEGHLSFCRAYENMVGRKPFIGRQIEYYRPSGAYTVHQTRAKSQGRLVINCSFVWQGERVTVTSFKDDSHALVACAYQPEAEHGEYERRKIRKRFTITHDQWQASQKLNKEGKPR